MWQTSKVTIFAVVTPLNPSTGLRETIRISTSGRRGENIYSGQKYWPAITKAPTTSLSVFDGDFSSTVQSGSASFDISIRSLADEYPGIENHRWVGSGVSLTYVDDQGNDELIFVGKVTRFGEKNGVVAITAEVDEEPFKADVLSAEYAGTTGIEGGADIKGNPKPLIFGRAKNVQPVQINVVDNIFQVSSYGAIQGITAVYERGAAFSASLGDYANYAALSAADIPEGRWATCLASGLFRLGAPPYGVITADVDGLIYGGVWIRSTGAIIKALAEMGGASAGQIDSASLTALDAATPYNADIVISGQIDVLSVAQRMALACNAQAGIDLLGRLFVTRVNIGTPVMILNGEGKNLPGVIDVAESSVRPPYKRIVMGADRSWRVHSYDEIAFQAELIDRGAYDDATVYREGNIVDLPDGSRWIFDGVTPLAGSAPTIANPNWDQMRDATAVDFANVTGPTKPAENATKNRMFVSSGEPKEYGPQLITNGDFVSGAGWSPETGWAISGGAAVATGATSGNELSQGSLPITPGATYEITLTATITSGTAFVRIYQSGQYASTALLAGTNTYTLVSGSAGSGSAFANAFVIAPGTAFTGTIDDVSIKGLVPAIVVDGDFWLETAVTPNELYTRVAGEWVLSSTVDAAWTDIISRPTWAIDGRPGNGLDALGNVARAVPQTYGAALIVSGVTGAGLGLFANNLADLDGTANTKLSGIEAAADVTANSVPFHDGGIAAIIVQADYEGTVETGQLPKNYNFKRIRGATDVSASATWSIVAATGCTATVTDGVVSLTAVSAMSASFTVRSVRDGVTINSPVTVSRQDADPPEAAGGGTSVYSSTAYSTSSSSFVAVSPELNFNTGTAGEAAFSAPLSLIVDAASPADPIGWDVEAKWQYREGTSGTWLDAPGGPIGETLKPKVEYEAPIYYDTDGSIYVNQTKTGLTASTAYQARLVARRSSGATKIIYFAGSRGVSGS